MIRERSKRDPCVYHLYVRDFPLWVGWGFFIFGVLGVVIGVYIEDGLLALSSLLMIGFAPALSMKRYVGMERDMDEYFKTERGRKQLDQLIKWGEGK